MSKSISGAALTAAALAFAAILPSAALVPSPAVAAPKARTITLLVRQDFSDCDNGNVSAAPPAVVGGEAMVTLRPTGQTQVNVRLTRVAPNTTYHLFLKCHYALGDIKTDRAGRGNNTFFFQSGAAGPVFAFDMYPDGAPLGNKYQSTQVNFH
jgi:hypothetical protein